MLPKIQDLAEWFELGRHEPKDGRYTAPPPAVTVTVRRHPEADPTRLPFFASMIVRCVDAMERALGGQGVVFDDAGTIEEPTRLTLRMYLLSGSDGFKGYERAAQIHDTLAELVARSRTELVARQDADIRAKIAAELKAPLPAELVNMLEVPPSPAAA